jgi:Haemolysin XhlA
MDMEEIEMDIWKQTIQKDIEDLKADNRLLKEDVRRVQDKQLLQDQEIKGIKEDLREIKDDTKWLRRAIMNAFIVALIGGAVAIFYAVIQK